MANRKQLAPGRLTRALALWATPIVEAYPGRLRGFAAATGISKSRLARLLNLETDWVASDIERFADAAGIALYDEALLQVDAIYRTLESKPALTAIDGGKKPAKKVAKATKPRNTTKKPTIDPFNTDVDLAAAYDAGHEPGTFTEPPST